MKRLLATCFGLGWLPLAPGSWGSLPPTIIFTVMCYFGTSAISLSIVMAALVLAGSIVCVRFAPAVIAATGKNDPEEIVADEIAGQSVTFLATGFLVSAKRFAEAGLAIETFSTKQILGIAALGFLLYRAFDSVKPWPIRKLEKLPAGWGILADDLMAGVYAAVALPLCLRCYAHWLVG